MRRNGGNVIVYVLISFHSTDVFCALGHFFVLPGFRLFCSRLAVCYMAIYSVSGSLVEQGLTATTETSTMAA